MFSKVTPIIYLFEGASCLITDCTIEHPSLDAPLPKSSTLVGRDGMLSAGIWVSATHNKISESSLAIEPVIDQPATNKEVLKVKDLYMEQPTECIDKNDEFRELLDCEDCGGGEWDAVDMVARCIGVAENDYQWKDCLCNDIQDKVCKFKDSPASGGGDEERGSRVDGLSDFTEESWSTGHPPA